ncbi:MAG: long-chain fatty acid--CoA ligase [Sphingomicrobium sp.]
MQDWPLRVMRLVDHAEREHGDREIVSAWLGGRITRTNWRTITHDARRMAQALESAGINPGDRVATLAMNHSAHLTAWYGAIGMGGVLHTINPRLFDEQILFIANHAGDRVLLFDRAFAATVDRLRPQLETIETYVCFDAGPADPEGFAAWLAPHAGDYVWVEGHEIDPCALCYTSGTTGNPRGVLYNHRSTMLHAMAEVAPDSFNLSARAVCMPIVPMFHANAWGIPWAAPLTGCKLVLSADLRPDLLCELFRNERVTHSAGVPTVWLLMIQHMEKQSMALPDLEHVTIGGSAAPRAMISWFRNHGIDVGHAWGMTETSPIGTLAGKPAGWDDMSDSAQLDYTVRQGRVPFGIELRVVGEDGEPLPRDGKQSGDLQIRGPWVIRRYFRDESDAVGEGSWFSTGDVAALHPDGTMQITDRSKDVIKSGGEWISSIELENATIGVPGVAEAAAIGIAHPKWDERPLLVVVRSEGSAVSREAIREHLATQVARWWLPDAIEFVDELPHTATGKLSKKTLREQFAGYRFADAVEMVGR